MTEVDIAILYSLPLIDEQNTLHFFRWTRTTRIRAGRFISIVSPVQRTSDPMLANIEDDAEYQAAATAFDIVLDNARRAEEGETLE